MDVVELVARFPEIPADLHEEPLLARFAAELGALLQSAVKPSPCAQHHEAGNRYYLKLIGPLAVYGYGLSTREQVLAQLDGFVEQHSADPDAFVAGLLRDGETV